jgi:hypothetical protein
VDELAAAARSADFRHNHFRRLFHVVAEHESVSVLNFLTETWCD